MKLKFNFLFVTLTFVVGHLAGFADEVSFDRDVRPILADRCFHCHGPDADNQESGFRLDTENHAHADLGGYFGIVAGDLSASELHTRIHSDGDDQMPPSNSVRRLTDREKDILDNWIREGASYDVHWSFKPLPAVVDLPKQPEGWVRNEIDRFISAEHVRNKVEPTNESSRETWLRRVSFDLTGLPPTLEQLDRFLLDESADSYERAVDRLLSSDACAERMTAEWLDVARYSDSYGYQRDDPRFVWPYRDWVIRAFQQNMPYDEFISLQIAGDLYPNATPDQILATTFNRLHSHKKEGGTPVEEFRVESVADRTHTFASAFLGLTMECCRCHDHKYDPITTKEYYQLSSYFANIDENGLISFFTSAVPTPSMPLASEAQLGNLAKAELVIRQREQELKQTIAESQTDFLDWLERRDEFKSNKNQVAHLSFDSLEGGKLENSSQPESPATTSPLNQLVEGRFSKAIKLTGDESVDLPNTGRFSRDQPFSISLWMNPSEVTERGVIYRRSRGWDDAGSIGYELTKLNGRLSAKLVHFWPGDAICVETDEFLKPNEWFHVTVTYDGSSKAAGLNIFVDGKSANCEIVQDCLTRQITTWNNEYLDLAIGSRYRDRGFVGGLVDEFQVFERELTPIEAEQLFDGKSLNRLMKKATKSLTADERQSLQRLFESTEHLPIVEARQKLREARIKWNQAMDATPAIMVMRESAKPRQSYLLKRGVYDQRGEPVSSGTPVVLPPFPSDQPQNRLGLAKWLTAPSHPLTARVAVNRYWQLIFGYGLVRTPEDFGMQGEPPTHPELLDWMARDFVEHGWDVKRLLKKIVLSATYRQDSVVSLEKRNRDPENRLYSRGPNQRLSAEMIRDNALATSGLLVQKVGGAPSRTYDLAAAYKPTQADKGEGLYRRSLYTFWQRTAPSPVMMTLNSNKREVCRLRRDVTDSPLQAFVLLNGTQFVEASRVFAGKLILKYQDDRESIIHEAFRTLTSRLPSEQERVILLQLFDEQLQHFTNHPEMAEDLVATGSAPPLPDTPIAEQAAATILVNAIMNFDESVRAR